jgi:hypothetical protein
MEIFVKPEGDAFSDHIGPSIPLAPQMADSFRRVHHKPPDTRAYAALLIARKRQRTTSFAKETNDASCRPQDWGDAAAHSDWWQI